MTDASGMDVFSATSRDAGATFGAPQLVAGGGDGSNQINPAIAIDQTTGRADIAYLDSRFNPAGFEVAATASMPPANAGTSESWSTAVPVETDADRARRAVLRRHSRASATGSASPR